MSQSQSKAKKKGKSSNPLRHQTCSIGGSFDVLGKQADNNDENEESWICKYCKKEFSDDSDKLVVCERCEMKVCLACTNGTVTDADYELLSRPDCSLHWFCALCDQSAMSAVKSDNLIETKCRQYSENMKNELKAELQKQLGLFSNRLDEMEKKMSDFQKNVPESQEAVKEQYSEIVKKVAQFEKNLEAVDKSDRTKTENETHVIRDSAQEIDERSRRKNNLIWFGIPEDNSEQAEDRIKADKTKVDDILKSVFDVKDSGAVAKARRLGAKKGGTPRPLLTTMDSSDRVSEVLKNARQLGHQENTQYKNVAVKKDQTPLEREEHRRLVMLRNSKREESQQKGTQEVWVIRKGKIVDISKRKSS